MNAKNLPASRSQYCHETEKMHQSWQLHQQALTTTLSFLPKHELRQGDFGETFLELVKQQLEQASVWKCAKKNWHW